ncbi:hypothetical protein [Leptolyngbya sp. FACHB-261]|uniref:hypothetical protein n=1 Tax=Leptolyngbya sp. FACHB-261 TaxID=2692806 RepID=UPI001689B8BA|nr:hypothetical protein [Leptolyngbya sp. FACHB-261]MBD2101770.1 hypothetical protein [Leptolyngbya sp. FACHB-261]
MSNLRLRKHKGWVPISFKLIRKTWKGKADWKKLESLNLIRVKPYDMRRGLSYEFKVPDALIEKFLSSFSTKTQDHVDSPMVNLFTGHLMKCKPKSRLTDSTGHPEAELIASAIKTVKKCFFNALAVEKHLQKLKAERDLFEKDSPQWTRACARYLNDFYCFRAIVSRDLVSIDGKIFSYEPTYSSQTTGRISEEGGGLQSCSRAMKEAAFQDINGIRNYDLKNSQANGLIQQFERAGLDTVWLKNYVADSNSKKKYAAQAGITVNCWKSCLYATMMGAYLGPGRYRGAVTKYLEDEADGDLEKAKALHMICLAVIKPFKIQLDKWHQWLREKYVELHSYCVKRKKYIKNATGKTLCLTDVGKDKNLLTRKISAFILQGAEAAFIHHLTLLSDEYGFKVLSNQHDGLVTLGTIPEEAVEIAREKSGLKRAEIEEKPFL